MFDQRFCRNSLQVVCDTPIARITGCVSLLISLIIEDIQQQYTYILWLPGIFRKTYHTQLVDELQQRLQSHSKLECIFIFQTYVFTCCTLSASGRAVAKVVAPSPPGSGLQLLLGMRFSISLPVDFSSININS